MYPNPFWYVSDSPFDVENTEKHASNTALRLTHVRERKLAVPPFRLFRHRQDKFVVKVPFETHFTLDWVSFFHWAFYNHWCRHVGAVHQQEEKHDWSSKLNCPSKAYYESISLRADLSLGWPSQGQERERESLLNPYPSCRCLINPLEWPISWQMKIPFWTPPT